MCSARKPWRGRPASVFYSFRCVRAGVCVFASRAYFLNQKHLRQATSEAETRQVLELAASKNLLFVHGVWSREDRPRFFRSSCGLRSSGRGVDLAEREF